MKLDSPQVWIGVFSFLAVISVGVVTSERTSPGPLAGVHGALPDLAAPNACAECHGGWTTSMTTACLDCHAPIEAQMDQDEGLHGTLEEGFVARCAQCHSEHHGTAFALVNAMSFKKAGFADREAFDHGFVGFQMQGKHTELDCSECHEHADTEILPEGAHRFLGVDQDCSTCHEDPHEGAMVRGCAECHGQETFEVQHSRGHERHLDLVGGHEALSCRECHDAEGEHALELLVRPGRHPDARACTDCHDSPHRFDAMERVAQLEHAEPEAACATCHLPEHPVFAQASEQVTPVLHERLGFALDDPHSEVGCAECHDPELAAYSERHPGRFQRSCAACHEDPHGGQFDDLLPTGEPYGPWGCTACHELTHFEPHAFDLERHARTVLPLEGSHAEADCSGCHDRPSEEAPRRFDGTPSDCDACHTDAHLGFFAPFTAELAAVEHGECARCHQPTAFADLPDQGFDHTAFTRFDVQGAHLQNECTICHERAAQPNEHGRRFGFACQPFDDFVGCATCHGDPHAGQFDAPGLPQTIEGRVACERCHDQSSFRSLPHGFEHGRWTGFVLDGAHRELACSQCHAPLRKPDDLGRTWRRALGTSCQDCHADPHAAQFELGGVTDCARCHGSTAAFEELVFDHDRDSRFPLEGAHAEAACSACHQSEAIEGTTTVRYKPLGTACTDCHGIQPGPLRSQIGG